MCFLCFVVNMVAYTFMSFMRVTPSEQVGLVKLSQLKDLASCVIL